MNSKILPSTLCRVVCIKPGFIGLSAPSFKYHIVFKEPGQEIQVKFEILQDSVHADNGYILNNSLRVMDRDVRLELGLNDDVEYRLTLKQVRNIILKGSLEELRDLFTYGPEGYARLAADLAVKEKIDSKAKLDLIQDFSGIDVAFQILHEIGIGALDEKNADLDASKERNYDTIGVTSENKDEPDEDKSDENETKTRNYAKVEDNEE
ncbi:MAG: hypothetical protein KQ78_01851 [Candidatus Izimaplasma bacterium HR2]|nr:MAG: hypothetical protein KQ78_01851 [Candidatus Izimaplasma bacterium HR2]